MLFKEKPTQKEEIIMITIYIYHKKKKRKYNKFN